MKHMKIKEVKQITLLLLTVFVITLIFGGLYYRQGQAKNKYVESTTPTFFFHGTASSYHAEEHMTHAAKRAGVTNTIVIADVHKNGQVTFKGNIKHGARNPIIEVNYENNNVWGKPDSWHINGDYAYDIVHAAQKKWEFTSMNLVAHSMGNIDVIYLLLDHQSQHLPKLKKQVAIAAHLNGWRGGGYPVGSTVNQDGLPSQEEKNFSQMKSLRNTYPQGAKVLNIYGDIQDGSHSDGEVPVNSAKTLKYLVGLRASSYQEKEIKGKKAQHSKLHENPQVDRLLINFLWSNH